MNRNRNLDRTFSTPRILAAWAVHALTGSTAVFGFLAILAIMAQEWQTAVIWMGVAAVIDGVDGALARWVDVKRVLPNFDGALLDNIVDYQTYVLVPAFFVYQAQLVPPGWLLIVPAIMLMTSGYQFAQADAKTGDHFFQGFPSYWNIVAVYLLLLGLPTAVNLLILLVCAVLVFIPIKYLYPSRMTRYRAQTLLLSALWFAMLAGAMFLYPMHMWLTWASLFFIVYYVGLSLMLTRQMMMSAR
ncbi:MAG: CDP-alcohol phosphatidyltransferase family protein [Chloroflexi bacterium]|nr:CDP-alcohol phosphatidyltransferase family protein [Chloroflexota bacterium]